MYANRVRRILISLIVPLTAILIGNPGCRRQPGSSSRATPSARNGSQPATERKARKSSRSKEKAQPKTTAEPSTGSGKKPSDDGGNKEVEGKGKKSTGKGDDREERPSGRGGDRAKRKRGKDTQQPVERRALKGIEFAFKPDWKPFDARNFGENYVFGYALGDRRSGRFAPRLVVRNVPGRAGNTEPMIKRWVGQFASGNDGQLQPTVTVDEMTIQKLNVKTVDITGGYQPDAERPPKADFRFLCAIIDHEDGPTVVKAIGPAATIEKFYEPIMELIKSVRPTAETKSPANP